MGESPMLLFRTAAAAVLLALQETPQDWIRQLGSEDPKVRDGAGAQLLKEGAKSRALLEKAVQDKDSEMSQRARNLIGRLNARTWSNDLGQTGAFWMDSTSLAFFADENNLPDSIKPLLHDEAEATFAIVRIEDGRARLQD